MRFQILLACMCRSRHLKRKDFGRRRSARSLGKKCTRRCGRSSIEDVSLLEYFVETSRPALRIGFYCIDSLN